MKKQFLFLFLILILMSINVYSDSVKIINNSFNEYAINYTSEGGQYGGFNSSGGYKILRGYNNTPTFNFYTENNSYCKLMNNSYYNICLQEYVDVATDCGGLSTGTTDFQSSMKDGIWTSYDMIGSGSSYTETYTKPINAFSATYKFRESSGNHTIDLLSLYPDCWNQNNIGIKVHGRESPIKVSCYNGTDYVLMFEGTGYDNRFYEGQMLWKTYQSYSQLDYDFIYQETANKSTTGESYFLNYTGAYSFDFTGDGGNWSDISNIIDGDWDTKGERHWESTSGNMFINYSIPSVNISSAKWHIKTEMGYVNDRNITIPVECLYSNNLQLKIFGDGGKRMTFYCTNSSGWQELYYYQADETPEYYYEDGIYWDTNIPLLSDCPNGFDDIEHICTSSNLQLGTTDFYIACKSITSETETTEFSQSNVFSYELLFEGNNIKVINNSFNEYAINYTSEGGQYGGFNSSGGYKLLVGKNISPAFEFYTQGNSICKISIEDYNYTYLNQTQSFRYQETTNKSTQEESKYLKYTGSYEFVGDYWHDIDYAFDGNWSGDKGEEAKYAYYDYVQDDNGKMIINYSLPTSFEIDNITWHVKTAMAWAYYDFNISIPAECRNQDILQLQIEEGGTATQQYFSCYNSTDWVLMLQISDDGTCFKIIEEGLNIYVKTTPDCQVTGTNYHNCIYDYDLKNVNNSFYVSCKSGEYEMNIFEQSNYFNYILSDTIYPSFINYQDNNGTLYNSGTGSFNITVENTNSTVFLEINNLNLSATNIISNVYNVLYTFVNAGIYTYKWYAYGNGTSNLLNYSENRNYIVNLDDIYPSFSNYQDNNNTLNNSGYAIFNVTVENTNGTVLLEINNINVSALNIAPNIYNATYHLSTNGSYSYRWFSFGNGTTNNLNNSPTRFYTVKYLDVIYPSFSNLIDNSNTFPNSGTGKFNVTVENTNGTVLLEINNVNVTATNLSSNIYNASYYFSTNGTYSYRWISYGNGLNHRLNNSAANNFIINYSIGPSEIDGACVLSRESYNCDVTANSLLCYSNTVWQSSTGYCIDINVSRSDCGALNQDCNNLNRVYNSDCVSQKCVYTECDSIGYADEDRDSGSSYSAANGCEYNCNNDAAKDVYFNDSVFIDRGYSDGLHCYNNTVTCPNGGCLDFNLPIESSKTVGNCLANTTVSQINSIDKICYSGNWINASCNSAGCVGDNQTTECVDSTQCAGKTCINNICTNSPPILVVAPYHNTTLSNPASQGSYVTFKGTYHHNGTNEQYKMFVCKTESFSNGACAGGLWCVSDYTNSDVEATCQVYLGMTTGSSFAFAAYGVDKYNATSGSSTINSPFYVNQKPTVSVSILPSLPEINSILNCSGIYSDQESGNESAREYVWYKNNAIIYNAANLSNVTQANLSWASKDIIKCSVNVYDNHNLSSGFVNSSAVKINNSIPTIPLGIVNITQPTYVGTTFSGTAYGSTDEDGNSITYQYLFFNINDSTTVQSWSTAKLYTIQETDKFNIIQIYAKACTTIGCSGNVSNFSNSILVHAPSINNVNITSALNITRDNTITCHANSSNDVDIYYIFNTTDGIILQNFSTASTFNCLLNGDCIKGKTIDCYAYSTDTLINSTIEKSLNQVTIINKVPTFTTALIEKRIKFGNNFTYDVGCTDIDSDNLTGKYYVFSESNIIDSINSSGTIFDNPILSEIKTSSGQYVGYNVNVTCGDGTLNTTSSFNYVILGNDLLAVNLPDDNSTSINKTLQGQNVTFTAIYGGGNGTYNFSVCKSNRFNISDKCLDGLWCSSNNVTLGNQATCIISTSGLNESSYAWYGYANNEYNFTGDNSSSPFYLNIIPSVAPTAPTNLLSLGTHTLNPYPDINFTKGIDLNAQNYSITTYIYLTLGSTCGISETIDGYTNSTTWTLGTHQLSLYPGNTYCYRARSYNGIYFSNYSSSVVFSLNSVPQLSVISMTPTTVYDNSILVCNAQYTDNELDSFNVFYNWTYNNAELLSGWGIVYRTLSFLSYNITNQVPNVINCSTFADDGIGEINKLYSNTNSISRNISNSIPEFYEHPSYLSFIISHSSNFSYQINATDTRTDTLSYYVNDTAFNVSSIGLISSGPQTSLMNILRQIKVTVSDGLSNISEAFNFTAINNAPDLSSFSYSPINNTGAENIIILYTANDSDNDNYTSVTKLYVDDYYITGYDNVLNISNTLFNSSSNISLSINMTDIYNASKIVIKSFAFNDTVAPIISGVLSSSSIYVGEQLYFAANVIDAKSGINKVTFEIILPSGTHANFTSYSPYVGNEWRTTLYGQVGIYTLSKIYAFDERNNLATQLTTNSVTVRVPVYVAPASSGGGSTSSQTIITTVNYTGEAFKINPVTESLTMFPGRSIIKEFQVTNRAPQDIQISILPVLENSTLGTYGWAIFENEEPEVSSVIVPRVTGISPEYKYVRYILTVPSEAQNGIYILKYKISGQDETKYYTINVLVSKNIFLETISDILDFNLLSYEDDLCLSGQYALTAEPTCAAGELTPIKINVQVKHVLAIVAISLGTIFLVQTVRRKKRR